MPVCRRGDRGAAGFTLGALADNIRARAFCCRADVAGVHGQGERGIGSRPQRTVRRILHAAEQRNGSGSSLEGWLGIRPV